MIFDGKKFAEEIAQDLEQRIKELKRKLKLVVIVDQQNATAVKYTNLKRQMAQRLGIDFKQITSVDQGLDADGIIVQLPYPDSSELIAQIPPPKDIDGLRDDSLHVPAVIRAVEEILKLSPAHGRILVVGSKGFVGSRLVKRLKCEGMDIQDFDPEKIKSADVIISATGKSGLISADMVKQGVVAIDVGYPQGDFDPQVSAKAAFFTPVPGGVGPVTVVMLFKNLLEAVA